MSERTRVLLPELTHGDHCCMLFSSPEEQVKATVPFLEVGLRRDERCVYVGDDASIERIRAAFKDAGISPDVEERKKRLILSSERDYLDQKRFSPEKMLAFLQRAYDSTISDGFTALRAAGDVAWQVGPSQDFKDIVYYEALLDVFFLGKRMIGMCEYPKSKCPPSVLMGILNSHRIASLDSDLVGNFHYVQPDILLEKDPEVLQARRVEWMTAQLRRARKAEEEVLRLNAELEQRVADRTAKLEAANKELEAFSYSVSHDLKAPLRAIRGFSEALLEARKTALDAEDLGLLEKVVDGARRMGRLIDDLLKLSRLGQAALRPEWVELGTLAEDVKKECLAPHPGRSIEVTIHPLPRVWGDPSLLRQVFVNLIGNAVKYTAPRERAVIEIGATERADGIDCYVKDNGVGFDPAHAQRIFEAFQRVHSPRDFEGSGVGLTIVDRIIQRHGGRVWAEGQDGQGAVFRFSLPSKRA